MVLPLPVLKKFRLGLDAFRSSGTLTPEEFILKGGAERALKKESKIITKLLKSIEKNLID